MSKKMTYQANTLIETGNSLSVTESTIYYLGLSRLLPQLPHTEDREEAYQTQFEPIIIPFNELSLATGTRVWSGEAGRLLCERIMNRNCIITRNEDTGELDCTVIFRRIKYLPKTGIWLKFNEDLIEWLLELKDQPYTPILLDEMISLSSTYSRKILELVLQYRKIRKRTVPVKDLRYYLGIKEHEYSRMTDFIKRCIEAPCHEITLHTSYDVTFDRIKTGRSITAIEFRIKDKKKQEEELEDNIRQADERAEQEQQTHYDPDEYLLRMLMSPAVIAQEWRLKNGYHTDPYTKNESELIIREMKTKNEQPHKAEDEVF